MAKIKLGSAPKTFSRKVSIKTIDGGSADINVQFRYKTRSEFAEFVQKLYPELSDQHVEAVDLVGASKTAVSRDVRYIIGSVESWDLEDEFNETNVQRLVDEFPGAANELMLQYRAAITEGRAKN